ncbi:MAG: hypothetical protein R3Y33_06970 [Clostridia bacterium]
MQYCFKCKNICDEETMVCPHCKRKTGLRTAKDSDMVYFIKTTEFESSEIDELFSNYSLNFEIKPYKTGIVSSVYDCTYMPTDKEIFVSFADYKTAKKLYDSMSVEEEEQIPEPPSKKDLVKQAVLIIAFLSIVTLVVLGTDAITTFIKSLF